MKLGTKVLLKKSMAKWHLDNPEIYQRPNGEMDNNYERETLVHLMCVMGVPVTGTVTGYGGDEDTYHVTFEADGIRCFYYIERKDFTRIRS